MQMIINSIPNTFGSVTDKLNYYSKPMSNTHANISPSEVVEISKITQGINNLSN